MEAEKNFQEQRIDLNQFNQIITNMHFDDDLGCLKMPSSLSFAVALGNWSRVEHLGELRKGQTERRTNGEKDKQREGQTERRTNGEKDKRRHTRSHKHTQKQIKHTHGI